MAFSGAFVFIEPSPYEVVGLLAIFVFAVTGLSLPRAVAPLLLLLILLNIGYAIAVLQVIDQPKPLIWVCVSVYLGDDCDLLRRRARHQHASAARPPHARLRGGRRGRLAGRNRRLFPAVRGHLRHVRAAIGRARGTFNDPNVLGAFLVLPAMLAFQRVLIGRPSEVVRSGIVLLILLAALFLSFSRAAWGQFAFCAVMSDGAHLRHQPLAAAACPHHRPDRSSAFSLMAVFVAALLSIGQVADLFKQRASLEQSYDIGHTGRFGRYILGFQVALEQPFGIGPLQFHSLFFPEDPHNTFLNAFMIGGWLGGFAYLTLVLVTVVFGAALRLRRARPGGRPTRRSTSPMSGWWPRAPSSTSTTGATTSWCSACCGA